MEQSSNRLYSGPLSQAAQKILAVLRVQSLHEARRNQSYSYNHRQMERFYGSQRESLAQSSWSMSQEEESGEGGTERSYRDSSNQPQSPQTSAYYQHSQTPDCSLSSRASSRSSPCWDLTLQRQTETYHQRSQIYSHRKRSEPPEYRSNQTLSLTQHEVTEAAASPSQRERHTPSLHLPESLFQHGASCGNSFEEIRPSFDLDLSPDVQAPDDELFPKTEHTHKEELSLDYHPVSFCLKTREETDKNTSNAQREKKASEGWNIPRNDSQAVWLPLLNFYEEATSGGEDGGLLYQQHESKRIHLPARQETHCKAYFPTLMENVIGEEGSGQLLNVAHEMQDADMFKERGQRDVTLLNEEGSANDTGGSWLLKTKENTRLERNVNLCLINVSDKSFSCETDGEKEREEEEKTPGIKLLPPFYENKEPPAGCQTGCSEKMSLSLNCQAAMHQAASETADKHHNCARQPVQCEAKLLLAGNMERSEEERTDVMDVTLEAETDGRTKAGIDTSAEDKMETEQQCCSDVKLRERQCETGYREGSDLSGGDTESEERDESPVPHVDREDECASTEDSGKESCSTPTLSAERSEVRAPCRYRSHEHHDNVHAANGSIRGSSSSVRLAPASTLAAGQNSSSVQDLVSTVIKPQTDSNLPASKARSRHPPLIPSFPLKRKQENAHPPSRRPPKWEPPRSSQEKSGEVSELKGAVPPGVSLLHKSIKQHKDQYAMKQIHQNKSEEMCQESSSAPCKPPKHKRAKREPNQGKTGPKMSHAGPNGGDHQNQSKAGCPTASLTSDPRVKDSGRLNPEEKMQMLEEAGKAKALVLTLVYRDGTTQLDPEQKLTPPVCGLLVLMKNNLDCGSPEDSLGPSDSLVYLKLEHTPAWAQLHTHQSQELFTRDVLLQVLSGSQLVVCYKAKDFLRTALQVYRRDLSWKQVASSLIQDPQVSGWLLDPANPSSCYRDLLNTHYKKPFATPALGAKKVSQVISGLCSLHWLNTELCSKLQSQGLWELYSDMELSMISVLAAMESHRIHVDKEALKRTSDLLGTKMKQLEQEAHRAAGEIFLVTSNTQLRTILFEKLCLHERCENKKLPKTVNKQQQSTSEAALLQLQDLHPLPKIILEYRQSYISSTWHQTSVVTGRISAKHPNFQALPRQPLQITKKQYVQGKEEEVVTVHPRAMFIPQDGWTFLSADFCQVELRLLAHLSCDPELLRIFINPQADVFTMLASQWKGVSELQVTSEDREHAKRIVYSVVYGAGRERLSGILGVRAEQASRFQDSFLQTYREVQTFIQRTVQQCHKQGYVLSIMGRRRTLPNINSPDWGVRMQAERQAVNFVVQGSAADLCKMAMIRIFSLVSSSSSLSARLLAQLHDELLYEVEDSQVEQFAALVKSTMESLQHIHHLGVHLKVPLKVAVSSGKSWGSMSELNIPSTSPSPSL